MLRKIRMLLMFGFVIQPHLSAKFCMRRYVNGKWITKGDCGGPERMSSIQKELQLRAADEKKKKKRIADKKWTVFQRIKYGNVDFFRGWDDYVNGFGDRDGDFWLGLEALNRLTKEGNIELKVKMISKRGIYSVAKYSNFAIGPGSDNYRLHVSGFSGNVTYDALYYNDNEQFSTKDADHDDAHSQNCAYRQGGGWWYGGGGCASFLNGNFNKTYPMGIWWGSQHLRFSEMKFRKRL